ncbi:unnamed protein product [Paramecium pentaurelia]|uniref:Uncharacterized protein n=1 Tax=Paramecium pentaurelia TaxID=43138 RepID=A0A8S1VH39_9CILI|nr:unnamed protein product [Paramecium pentaurelia]
MQENQDFDPEFPVPPVLDSPKSQEYQKLHQKYQAIKQIVMSNENSKNPSEVLQKLQAFFIGRQGKVESQSDQTQPEMFRSANVQSGNVSRRFIYQKPGTANNLNYTQELEKQNSMLKQRIIKVSQARENDTNQIQLEYNKMKVRVENLEKENKKLKSDFSKCYTQLKEMKQEKEEEEKMKWHREAVSDKNPYLMEEFRKKLDEKDKEIKRLSKNLKKFTILEKKLWVKEKAFEVERSEYLDRILYLSGRLGLTKLE